MAASPQDRLVSILPSRWGNEKLYIFQLPSGDLVREIDLLICPDDLSTCEFDEDAVTSFMRWSPNGRYLAFAAARGSLSTDLYAYDVELDVITQLTNGDNQVGNIYWSPDSLWIVHEEVLYFHGWQVEGIWAAKVDGSEVNWVGDGMGGSMNIIDWISEDQFLVWTGGGYGPNNLRLLDIKKGLIVNMFEGYMMGNPVYNPIEHVLGFAPLVGAPETEEYQSGYYLVSPYQTTPYYSGLSLTGVFWDPISGDFIALDYECTKGDGTAGDAYAFNINGKKECVVAPERPVEEQLDYIVVGGGE